jgi:predicted nicotinamide N-methyase
MPGYLVKQELISIAGVDDLIIRSLLDRQQFSDPHGAALRAGISSATWPLFGLPWPSGAQLAARVALRPVNANERILEIGCGLALASLVAHRRGADVTASDNHPLAGSFLAENLRLNGLEPMKYRHGDWAADQRESGGPDDAPLPRAVHGAFELVIGSDLLYERDENGDLASFIERHCAPSCEVWIVDPDRSNRSAFSRRMAGAGFALREERLDALALLDVPAYKGRLLIYSRAAPSTT